MGYSGKIIAFLAAGCLVSLLIYAASQPNTVYPANSSTVKGLFSAQDVVLHNLVSGTKQSDRPKTANSQNSTSSPPSNNSSNAGHDNPFQSVPDSKNAEFIIPNENICLKGHPQLLIWVYSAPDNFERRKSIRDTWANTALYLPAPVVVVFSLAVTKKSSSQEMIRREQEKFADLVQDGSFVDAYANLTYKAQSMLRWTSTYCKDVKLLLKVDDDSFILPKRLVNWMQQFEAANSWPQNSIIGTVWRNPKPHRSTKSKWSVSEEQWPEPYYAAVACPGSGYFISGDAVPKLVDAIDKVRFLWLEDMYTTGVLAEKVRLNHRDNSRYHHAMYTPSTYRIVSALPHVYLIGHMPGPTETYKLWQKLVG